jgi:tetratricopeptide (TPR) repeat protein
VNIPEFVNVAGDGIEEIAVPAIDGYRLMDEALALEKDEKYTEALEVWKKAVALEPDDARVQSDIAANLYLSGNTDEAVDHIRESVRLNPSNPQSHYYLGAFLLKQGHPDEALPELERTLELNPRYPSGEATLAGVYGAMGRNSEALVHWRKAIAVDPKNLNALVAAARIMASSPDISLRDGAQAVAIARQAEELTNGTDPNVLDALAAAYAEDGQFPKAVETANRALKMAVAKGDSAKANAIQYRINLYEASKPYRN